MQWLCSVSGVFGVYGFCGSSWDTANVCGGVKGRKEHGGRFVGTDAKTYLDG